MMMMMIWWILSSPKISLDNELITKFSKDISFWKSKFFLLTALTYSYEKTVTKGTIYTSGDTQDDEAER
jgi:hypothetical protein